ncbi:autotransporter outer membrane beta-barrel domain-containing protein [Novosphingobium sp. Leaf2]|uniref:autotransporter outer membrane beta-barrel domain-containing protein n=1 Tax=Novosphingobium sp. Leaf2 TaxID=1735670 RepID=UPI000B1E24FF|nr:autotransporter outer membrane beta-barrel domain-containing protein [Novosphingobium sp. Leaf2]
MKTPIVLSTLAPLLALLPGARAAAQDTTAPIQAPTTVSLDAAAQPADAATADPASPAPPLWTAALSTGISARDSGPDGTWQTLNLTRRVGRGYVRGTVMRYHGTLLQSDVALPSDYYVGTIGAGGNFDNWVIDGWASYGRQVYGRISTSAGSRASTGSKASDYYAAGGDFGRVVPLGGNFFLTPTIAAAFAQGKLLRPAPTGTTFTDLETNEPTWSANAATRIDYAFGPQHSDYVGLSLSRNWTSNGISMLRIRPELQNDGALGLGLFSKHYPDSWFEAGASTSLKLRRDIYLDLFATRSFGVSTGDITTGGLSLRKSF